MKNLSNYIYNNQLSYSEYYSYIRKEQLTTYKDIYDKINFVKELNSGNNVFFDSSSTIPRYKFNNYGEDKGIKRTILKKKANVIVINPEVFTPLLNLNKTNSYFVYTADEIRNFCEKNKLICNVKDGDEFVSSHNSFTIQTNNYQSNRTSIIIPGGVKTDLYISYNRNIDDLVKDFLKNEEYINLKFIKDEDLNRLIGSEGLVIDEEYFKEITKMLESSDPGNIKIALEIIANSNYEKNLFPISIILNTYRDKITNPLKESVNLKNFTNYFKEVQWQQSTTNFLYSLRKELINKKDFTKEKENYLDTAMLSYINTVLKPYKVSTSTFNWE